MTLVDLLALALAAAAIIDVWQNGAIFESLRAYMETRTDVVFDEADGEAFEEEEEEETDDLMVSDWWMRVLDRRMPTFFAWLLNCPYCFSFWTPALLVLPFYIPSLFLWEPWSTLCKIPIYCLAATRIGFIVNLFLPDHGKYRRKSF